MSRYCEIALYLKNKFLCMYSICFDNINQNRAISNVKYVSKESFALSNFTYKNCKIEGYEEADNV